MRKEGTAGVFDRALFRDNVRRSAPRLRDQREERVVAKDAFRPRRWLRMLLGNVHALQEKYRRQQKPRRQKLSVTAAVDDLALTRAKSAQLSSGALAFIK
jgi:hypothetical protein